MKRLLKSLAFAFFEAVIIIAAVYGTWQWIKYEPRRVAAVAQSYVVRFLHEDDVSGSGVVISPGRILTAAHLFPGRMEPEGWEISDGSTFYKIEYIDHEVDIAIIAAGVDCPCASLVHEDPHPLEETLTVGHPAGLPLAVVTEGRWQGKEGMYYDVSTGHAMPGVSGGGVFITRHGVPLLTGVVVKLQSASVISPAPYPAWVPVYYLVSSVNQYQIKQALMCADNPGSMWCEGPDNAERYPEREEEEQEEGEEGEEG